jgi:N-carbamoylputrescine amidase
VNAITVAATQMACSTDFADNCVRAEALVRNAKARGGQIVLLQELFAGPYFCQVEEPANFRLAAPAEGHLLIAHFRRLAAELNVVLPISFFERANRAFYNSVAIIDADGALVGIYRKSHIPDGPGYEEKYYFSPGDTGFRVWKTKFGNIGVGICWDQWFPECARALCLRGADFLLYPTAIGSDPGAPHRDYKEHWQVVMRGHAGANVTPVIASNRVGREIGKNLDHIDFFGSSFIADQFGQVVAEAPRQDEAVVTARFDLESIAQNRAELGLFRDRRPDLYGSLLTLDGTNSHLTLGRFQSAGAEATAQTADSVRPAIVAQHGPGEGS